MSTRDAPTRIFLSHVRADEAWASWARSVLAAAGVDTAQLKTIPSGERLVDVIATRIAEADQLWVVYSSLSARSPNVALEIGQAVGSGVPITYLLVDDEPAPAAASASPLIDLRIGSLRRLEARLLAAAGRGADRPTLAHGRMENREAFSDVTSARLDRRFPAPAVLELTAVARPRLKAALEDAFLRDGAPGRSVALVGMAGSGKTHLAARFVAEQRWRFRDIAWLRAADLEAAVAVLRQRADALLRSPRINDDPERVLAVVDDADEADHLRGLTDLPASVDVLVVGRLRPDRVVTNRKFCVIAVGPAFELDEAFEYAARAYPDLPSYEVTQLIDASGASPLLLPALLEAASSWDDGDALEVLETLRRAARDSSGAYFLDTDDPRLIASWERSFARLTEDESAVELDDFEKGSWRRRWRRRYTSERTEQILDAAERAAEVAALTRPEADANRNNAEAIARLIEASTEIPNLVVMSGSVLLVKVTDDHGPRIVSKTLTASQLRAFEADQHLTSDPVAALAFLASTGEPPPPLPGGDAPPRSA